MARVPTFYSFNEWEKSESDRIHHGNNSCSPGREIPQQERRNGRLPALQGLQRAQLIVGIAELNRPRTPVRRSLPLRYRNNKLSDKFFIEQRAQGDYAIRKPNSQRASAVVPTQKKAVALARKMNPDAAIHVERVRDVKTGSRDRWRKLL